MNNFFLLNEAITTDDYNVFLEGSTALIIATETASAHDFFYKHTSVWDLGVWIVLFTDGGQKAKAILKFIEQMRSYHIYIKNEQIFDHAFPDSANGFLGFDFTSTTIPDIRQIKDLKSFEKFKTDNLWNVTFRNFWDRRNLLYPNLILCGEVEEQVSRIGNSDYFSQIIEKLKEFNKAAKEWVSGTFNHRTVNQNYALTISAESDSTMRKYGNERIFGLPDGRREYFELHIKTGDLRFHFYPDDKTKKIYVGYIGPHLSTVSN